MSEKRSIISKNAVIVAASSAIIIAVAALLILMKENKPEYENAVVTSQKTSAQTTAVKSSHGDIVINMTDEVQKLIDFNAEGFVKTAFEMKNQFAFEPFESPEKASVNKITQLAFCHIYSGEKALTDFEPLKNSVYRTATEANIRSQMSRMFENADKIDIKNSDLYNQKEKKFEMWQPNYKTEVFARCNAKLNGELIELRCTFYSDSEKTNLLSEATVTVKYFKGNANLPACYRIAGFK